jgi:hypothetical protein
MSREEKNSHKQMRILRLRYDELNRTSPRLVLKKDYEEYCAKLQQLVERALKNSGYHSQPVFVDRKRSKTTTLNGISNKGKVVRRR